MGQPPISRQHDHPWLRCEEPQVLMLFGIDGTLTMPRLKQEQEMRDFMMNLKGEVVVGGSDYVKAKEQIGETCAADFHFLFPENGLVAFRDGEQFHSMSLRTAYTEEQLQSFIKFCMKYIADLEGIPAMRGTFIEFDNQNKVRAKLIDILKEKFADMNLHYSIGGQISLDVFPKGWDKTYCLQHIKEMDFDQIHFFGDKTAPGGNDHEIFASDQTIGHTVTSPENTREQVNEVLASLK